MTPIQDIRQRISQASVFLEKRLANIQPDLAIILGSGFANWVDSLHPLFSIHYKDIPGFLTTGVVGHPGRLHLAKVEKRHFLILQGRFHYYEGHQMMELGIPIRVLRTIGIKNLVITNAAGGINKAYAPGHLMLISDHINLSQSNPLIGPNFEEFGTRFPDAGNIYDSGWRLRARELGKTTDLVMHEGVYLYNRGPSFETPAEIRMMSVLGADAVGMSTVPEALIANHAGMNTLGMSLITNFAAGISEKPLAHQDVVNTMSAVQEQVYSFLEIIVRNEVTK